MPAEIDEAVEPARASVAGFQHAAIAALHQQQAVQAFSELALDAALVAAANQAQESAEDAANDLAKEARRQEVGVVTSPADQPWQSSANSWVVATGRSRAWGTPRSAETNLNQCQGSHQKEEIVPPPIKAEIVPSPIDQPWQSSENSWAVATGRCRAWETPKSSQVKEDV